jgi:tRNA(fMet)-specific endonuclease VapC
MAYALREQPIGGDDMLIAAHALSVNATMVTANEKEFLQVEGLSVENWLL